ncbi:MAG: hypothetical protein JNL21_33160 [Myxococcales bacterium]|nr:hypothetical protein [Myxococcales bacterium]
MSRRHPTVAQKQPRPDDGHAFIQDPTEHEAPPKDAEHEPDAAGSLAEELGEEFVVAATSNEDMGEQRFEQTSVTEVGGPFLDEDGGREIVDDNDSNNPPGATREPFPTAMRSDLEPPSSIVTGVRRGSR